jgi:hypothetical protein
VRRRGGAVGQESQPFCRRAWTSGRSGPAQLSTMRLWRTLHRWPTRAWGAAEAAFEWLAHVVASNVVPIRVEA